MTTRTLYLLFSACSALLALAGIAFAVSALGANPHSIASADHGAQVEFSIDRQSFLPGQCAHVRWEVEHIQEVYLNGVGQAGAGEREICPTGETVQNLRVIFRDNTIRIYSLATDILIWKPRFWLPLAVSAVLLTLAGLPWLPRYRQMALAAVVVLFGAVLLLSLVYRIVFPGEVAVISEQGNTQVYFASEHRWLASPFHCTTLHWHIEGAKEVYLGGEGRIGQGQQRACSYPDKIPTLNVIFPDGTNRVFQLSIHSLLDRHGLSTLAAGLGLIFAGAYLVRVPPTRSMVTTAWQAVHSRATNPELRAELLQVFLTAWIFGITLMLWVISGHLGLDSFLNYIERLRDFITDLFHVSFE